MTMRSNRSSRLSNFSARSRVNSDVIPTEKSVSWAFSSAFSNALGDFDFLFAGQQRDLAHLLEVHANRVVENIMPAGFRLSLFLLFLFRLEGVYLAWVQDLDFEILKNGHDVIDVVLAINASGNASLMSL